MPSIDVRTLHVVQERHLVNAIHIRYYLGIFVRSPLVVILLFLLKYV